MGKEGQLLDDSALINAFDQAISKYKKMHGKESKDSSTTDVNGDAVSKSVDVAENVNGDAVSKSVDVAENVNGDAVSKSLDVAENDTSNPKVGGDEYNIDSHVSEEVDGEEARNLEAVAEHEVADSQFQSALDSYSLAAQYESHNYSSGINSDEYSKLYKQYYEIEEQRQKILQQMQQFSYEYYPYSGEGFIAGEQWGTILATQECQGTSQMPGGTMVVSCCPCASQCSMASCSSLTCPSASTRDVGLPATEGLELKPAVENVDFVAEALGAAEKAISALKVKTSDLDKENKLCAAMGENDDPETDLSKVLNAWYSAGFYTAKYLTEKSLAKKRHD